MTRQTSRISPSISPSSPRPRVYGGAVLGACGPLVYALPAYAAVDMQAVRAGEKGVEVLPGAETVDDGASVLKGG